MHDVLAHRISLISVHAGALAYRTAQADAGTGTRWVPGEVGGAIEVIRDNARQALVELGDVLTVLRTERRWATASRATRPGRPTGGAAAEAGRHRPPDPGGARRGQRVTFEMMCAPGADESLRPAVQRTVYRTIQEGLTNARKHAGQAEVAVRVEATPSPGSSPRSAIRCRRTSRPAECPAPAGLTGLAERLTIDGGSIEHGVIGGTFRLTTRLPWPL